MHAPLVAARIGAPELAELVALCRRPSAQRRRMERVSLVSKRLIEVMTVFDVVDPEEIGTDSRVSGRFPSSNNKHRYTLRNGPRRSEPQHGVLSRFAMRHAGDLLLGFVADRYGTKVEITADMNRLCLGTMLTGAMDVRTVGGAHGVASGSTGLVYRGDAATRLHTGDGNSRFNLWVPVERVDRALRATLGIDLKRPVEFEPTVDWSATGAASVQGLIQYLCAEMERGEAGLLANPMALATFTDLLTQGLLNNLRHSYSDRLSVPHQATVPRSVRRAEEYLRAHASEPVRMEDLAAAAGCSLRALQMAFRRFRDTTPRAVLLDIRLDSARADLVEGVLPVAQVAARWGFLSVARFAAAYERRFGERPVETRRAP